MLIINGVSGFEDIEVIGDADIGGDLNVDGDFSLGGDMTLTAGGTITSTANGNVISLPNGTGITVIGSGSTSYSLNTPGSLLVSDELEVTNAAYFASGLKTYGNINMDDGTAFTGLGTNARILPSDTVQTNNVTKIEPAQSSNIVLICEWADRLTNFGWAAQTNPTLILQSADATDTTQWLSLAHNQTNGVIDTGAGCVQIGTAGSTSHSMGTNDLFVSGDLEVSGTTYLDNTVFIKSNVSLAFGSSGNSLFKYGTSQTNNSVMFGTPSVAGDSRSIIVCEAADASVNFGHAIQTNPTIFLQSSDATDTTQFIKLHHDQADARTDVGKGGLVSNHEAPVELADDASFVLPDASAGFGEFMAGDNEEWAQITWGSDGVTTLVANSSNVVANADTDANLCFIDGGTQVSVKNRLGAAKKIMFRYNYTTP